MLLKYKHKYVGWMVVVIENIYKYILLMNWNDWRDEKLTSYLTSRSIPVSI